MSVKHNIHVTHGTFFVTFTCYQWHHLFAITEGYDLVYKWFDYLIHKKHQIAGYVIMPNHVHVLVALYQSTETINKIVGNGKRLLPMNLLSA